MNTSYTSSRFLDPYAVEGKERAKRLAHNYNQQKCSGFAGVLESYAILREAQLRLSAKHMKYFCRQVQLVPGSEAFKKNLEIGDRYDHWRTVGLVAILDTISVPAEQFDRLLEEVIALCYGYIGGPRPHEGELTRTVPDCDLR